jgi:hypothetical protein
MIPKYLFPDIECCEQLKKWSGSGNNPSEDTALAFDHASNTWFILSDYIDDTEVIFFCPFCGKALPHGSKNPEYIRKYLMEKKR